MELFHGSPTDLAGRSDREIRTYAFLDSLGISFDRTDHPDRPATTMEVCAEADAILDVHICKNLFLCNKQETKFYLLMMPGDKVFKTSEVSHQIGSTRLSFASPENMHKYLGLAPGSVSIMGLMNDRSKSVQLLIDEDVLKDEYLGCHPCVNTSSLKIRTDDLFGKFLKSVNHTYRTVRLTGE
jgi:Ala-tRNA(Pro) deacylase